MRIGLAVIAVSAAVLLPLSSHAQTARRVAPADEYFGKTGMSILGIRNHLNDISTRIDGDASAASGQLAGAESVEDAIRDWAQKYPQDTWLDRSAVTLERVYARIGTGESRTHLQTFATWIHARFAGQAIDGDCQGVVRASVANPGELAPR